MARFITLMICFMCVCVYMSAFFYLGGIEEICEEMKNMMNLILDNISSSMSKKIYPLSLCLWVLYIFSLDMNGHTLG